MSMTSYIWRNKRKLKIKAADQDSGHESKEMSKNDFSQIISNHKIVKVKTVKLFD